MPDVVREREVTITRVFPAPRELVWRAWTEPERLARWWGPHGWRTDPRDVTLDVRPGGTFRVSSVSDAGAQMTTAGVYREVVEPDRLVFEESAEDSWHDGAVSTLTLTELGDGRTEMVLRSAIRTTEELGELAAGGMRGAIDRLAELLA
jgi:uncharacterized protein YndB with AHSA1/START domain